jgi:hypothetical protein
MASKNESNLPEANFTNEQQQRHCKFKMLWYLFATFRTHVHGIMEQSIHKSGSYFLACGALILLRFRTDILRKERKPHVVITLQEDANYTSSDALQEPNGLSRASHFDIVSFASSSDASDSPKTMSLHADVLAAYLLP